MVGWLSFGFDDETKHIFIPFFYGRHPPTQLEYKIFTLFNAYYTIAVHFQILKYIICNQIIFRFWNFFLSRNLPYYEGKNFKDGNYVSKVCKLNVQLAQWRSRVKIIGGARAPFFLFSPSPTYGIYIFFLEFAKLLGGPGPPGPLNAATPL